MALHEAPAMMKQTVTAPPEINATMVKFGYPETLVREYSKWMVLVRPAQVTLGSLVLVCKDPATAFSRIGAEAFRELETVIGEVEASLSALWSYQKINYLMLMMVDKDVHFHVIPRYDGDRLFEGVTFSDAGWPRAPDLAKPKLLEGEMLEKLTAHLRANWPQ